VIDFSQLKRLTREVCETLDHEYLLQMDSRTLTINDDDTQYVIQYRDELSDRLPKHDVAALPIDNSTAERLSQYIAGRLIESLSVSGPSGLARLRVGVEEMPGQAAWFETNL